ncbi:hypothetical protein PVL29_026929 [Vitis rotundifolia]|uniref:HXXXD-type acyl-transferase family protein n=1 Tax=Vitis rotundifolia TaxID=103349 RepID=A0AA38YHR4_VITRO|nr:hypothetical protein PVL29_026929 [Vitis rotundifolia]
MGTHQISSLQTLLAHLWRSIIRNRRLPEDQETMHRFPIGMRSRLRPPLPLQYFGATVQLGVVTMKVGELLMLGLGLGHAAWQLNKVIATYTEADQLLGILASCSPKFSVYGNDFGWGRPVAVRSASANKTGAKTTLFPGAEEGSIDIEAFLMPEILQSVIEDAEFVETLTI